MVSPQIGSFVGDSEVERIEAALTAQERLRAERDQARDHLLNARFHELRASLDGLTNRVGTQNGRIDKIERAVIDIAKQDSVDKGIQAGQKMATDLFYKLVGTGIALVAAATGIGALLVSWIK